MDVLLILLVASLLSFVAMVVLDKRRELGFLTVILSTCALCASVQDPESLGDVWLLLAVPLVFVLLMSIVAMVKAGGAE